MGQRGTFRAPRASCALDASNDYQAVNAWLSLHESRRPAGVPQGGRTADPVGDRRARAGFVVADHRGRHCLPRLPASSEPSRALGRRPAAAVVAGVASLRGRPLGALGSLRAVGAQRPVPLAHRAALRAQANPFAGVKVRGGRPAQLDTSHAFTEHEWKLVRVVADGLEWSYGWSEPAAQRLRFMLDFAYATGLRISELVGAQLGAIDSDAHGDAWIRVVGKGQRPARSCCHRWPAPPFDRYLVQRGCPDAFEVASIDPDWQSWRMEVGSPRGGCGE